MLFRYGGGYVVSIMFKSPDDLDRGASVVETSLGGVGPLTKRNTTLSFKVTDNSQCTPSQIFNFVQSRKATLHIQDFSIQQTTLDEVCKLCSV